MSRYSILSLFICGLIVGCSHAPHIQRPASRPVNLYAAPKFDWASVRRIALMPLANETEIPHAGHEMRKALAAELQASGRFQVVLPPYDPDQPCSEDVLKEGQFDELEILRLARQHQVQGVLFGSVTQYQPYAPPRVGLNLLMISPVQGVVIASSNDLWDAREQAVAEDARYYHHQNLDWPGSLFVVDRAIESPEVFRRFVAHKVARSLARSTQPARMIVTVSAEESAQPVSDSVEVLEDSPVARPADGEVANSLSVPPMPEQP